MTDVAFYQLERSPLEQVLPKLLEKTLDAGKRALVVATVVQASTSPQPPINQSDFML